MKASKTDQDVEPLGVREKAQTDVPYAVRLSAAWIWRVLIIAAGIGGLLWVMGLFKTIVVPVLVALLFTVLLRPFFRFMVAKGILHNPLAHAITVLGFLAGVV